MFHPPKQLSSDSSFFWTSGSSTEQTHGSKRLNIMPSVFWILWHGCLDHHMVGRKQTAGCDIFEGGRCEITPRRFQVKSIIDKVSAVAMLRQCCPLPGQLETASWQPGGNGVTRQGANTRQTYKEGKINRKFENPTRSWALRSLYWNFVDKAPRLTVFVNRETAMLSRKKLLMEITFLRIFDVNLLLLKTG